MTAAERYLNLSARDLRLELDELYAQYVGCLDEERFEDWPEFFTDDCLYRIVPRDNFERGLPIATWHSEGRAGLLDSQDHELRAAVYPSDGERNSADGLARAELDARANFLAVETLLDEPSRVFMCGEYRDRLVVADGKLKFREKHCVFDTLLILNSLIYPL
jgi:salicylate 5-hydroxylase small subunit